MALYESQPWISGLSRAVLYISLFDIVPLFSKKELRRNSGSQKEITTIKGATVSLHAAPFSYVVVF